MKYLYWVDTGARPIYIIQRPYIKISAIITVYISYLAANMAKQFLVLELYLRLKLRYLKIKPKVVVGFLLCDLIACLPCNCNGSIIIIILAT